MKILKSSYDATVHVYCFLNVLCLAAITRGKRNQITKSNKKIRFSITVILFVAMTILSTKYRWDFLNKNLPVKQILNYKTVSEWFITVLTTVHVFCKLISTRCCNVKDYSDFFTNFNTIDILLNQNNPDYYINLRKKWT